MSNQATALQNNPQQIIKNITLSYDPTVFAIPRVLIKFTQNHGLAMFLSDLIYWSDKGMNPFGWIYRSAKEWEERLEFSSFQVKQNTEKLIKMGILETVVMKPRNQNNKIVSSIPVTHYRLNFEKLGDLLNKFKSDSQESHKSDFQETHKSIDFQETHKSYNTKISSSNITKTTTKPLDKAETPELDKVEIPGLDNLGEFIKPPEEIVVVDNNNFLISTLYK